MSNSATAKINGSGVGSSKNRFFSLSRRFRFRAQSPDKGTVTPLATVHFLDEDIDLETKERTLRKSDPCGSRPSKGILKTLRHRSPFRFRSKDAAIPEQEPSAPPSVPASPLSAPSRSSTTTTKEKSPKVLPPVPTSTQTKHRGRLVELRKTAPKSSSSNGTTGKSVNATSNTQSTGSTLVRKTSGLKDLIHKFEATPSDRSSKFKRAAIGANLPTVTSSELNQNEQSKKRSSHLDLSMNDQQRVATLTSTNKSKATDIPDLLQNVAKDPTTTTKTKSTLKHSNSIRQTASFDSTASMVSANDSVLTTNSSTRRPTSTARPLMISLVSQSNKFASFIQSSLVLCRAKMNHSPYYQVSIPLFLTT